MGLIHRKESITITEYRHGERANYPHSFSRLYCCKYGGSLKPIVDGGYYFIHSHYLTALAVRYIPFLLEAAAVLATFVHPNHIVCLCSWGFTHLPPTCNFTLFGYKTHQIESGVLEKNIKRANSRADLRYSNRP
ncbi:hypothetical protein C7R88_08760 [Plesiomonas shigelloides]|nr:hypothetical protein C7R88_08760 [Plesiomonas shigelloides]